MSTKWPVKIYNSESLYGPSDVLDEHNRNAFYALFKIYMSQQVKKGTMAVRYPDSQSLPPAEPVLNVPTSDGGYTIYCFDTVESAQHFLDFIQAHVPGRDMSTFKIVA